MDGLETMTSDKCLELTKKTKVKKLNKITVTITLKYNMLVHLANPTVTCK